MQDAYNKPSGEGQSRKSSPKSSALRRSDATKRSPPLVAESPAWGEPFPLWELKPQLTPRQRRILADISDRLGDIELQVHFDLLAPMLIPMRGATDADVREAARTMLRWITSDEAKRNRRAK